MSSRERSKWKANLLGYIPVQAFVFMFPPFLPWLLKQFTVRTLFRQDLVADKMQRSENVTIKELQ